MNKNAFFGLLVLLLAFSFIGCDNDNGNPFVGTWSYTNDNNGVITTFIITETNWSLSVTGPDGEGIQAERNGNYTYSGNTFTMTTGTTGSGTISGDTLTVTFSEFGFTLPLTKI